MSFPRPRPLPGALPPLLRECPTASSPRSAAAPRRGPARPALPREPRPCRRRDELLLLNFGHQPAATPYRARHAIYVSRASARAFDAVDEGAGSDPRAAGDVRAFDAAHHDDRCGRGGRHAGGGAFERCSPIRARATCRCTTPSAAAFRARRARVTVCFAHAEPWVPLPRARPFPGRRAGPCGAVARGRSARAPTRRSAPSLRLAEGADPDAVGSASVSSRAYVSCWEQQPHRDRGSRTRRAERSRRPAAADHADPHVPAARAGQRPAGAKRAAGPLGDQRHRRRAGAWIRAAVPARMRLDPRDAGRRVAEGMGARQRARGARHRPPQPGARFDPWSRAARARRPAPAPAAGGRAGSSVEGGAGTTSSGRTKRARPPSVDAALVARLHPGQPRWCSPAGGAWCAARPHRGQAVRRIRSRRSPGIPVTGPRGPRPIGARRAPIRAELRRGQCFPRG